MSLEAYGFIVILLTIQCFCALQEAKSDNPNQKAASTTPTSGLKDAIKNPNISEIMIVLPVVPLNVNDTSVAGNSSDPLKSDIGLDRFGLDNGAVKRTFYVVATLTGIVLLYFTIKGVSTLRRRRRKPRRYGLLADNKEMSRFRDEGDEDSDEEDATLFDARKHKAGGRRGP